MAIDVIITLLLMWAAFLLGFFVKSWMTAKFRDYSGTLVVDHDDLTEKTVYSLVLDDYPEKLEFKKVVVFKVERPEEKSNRE